jgi:exodeoxyribonuclease V alpha subunit
MDRVQLLCELGIFNNQDVALAKMAENYSSGLSELPFITAWVSQWTQSGHVCLPWERTFEELAGEIKLPVANWPHLPDWVNQIPLEHPFVGDGSRNTPLVIDRERKMIYLHRWFKAEERVAKAIQTRMEFDRVELAPEVIKLLDDHFPSPESISSRQAVKTALSSPFSIITGGPGPGKTTTILKLIDLFVAQHGEGVRIALCAPTGKAVSRMDESIQAQVAESGNKGLERIFSFETDAPVDAPYTLHRLLGINPVRGTCRYNQANRLPHELVIVDESSMMDLLLMNQLIHALKPEAHLILVGDKDQLPAVGSGSVFADLCRAEGLSSVTSILTKNWRAKDAPGIVELASAVNDGRAEDAIQLLIQGNENIQWHRSDKKLDDLLKTTALQYWKGLKRSLSAEEAFDYLTQFQMLCAIKQGFSGVNAINQLAQEMLGERRKYYSGLPIMISTNDPHIKLFNGDLGVVFENDQGVLEAWFSSGSEFRSVALSRLPQHDPVYAMTIHKSQGSEAANIGIVLPEIDSPILTRELLYTAITRAKQKVDLWASESILRTCISRTVSRVSGLSFKFMTD